MRALFIYSIIVILCSCSGQKKQNAKNGEATIPEPSEEEPAPVKNESTLTNVFTETATEPEMVFFEGGTFKMGSENGLPNERPVHEVTISPFYIDKTPVTTEQFSRFIKASGYKTEAEKFGDSGVFNLDRQAWELLPGAYWEKPLGPSGPDAEPNHPVTHVSWNDAVAYASWAEKRLPTEAEWEYAAYGLIGNTEDELLTDRRLYPWNGSYLREDRGRTKGRLRANFIRGRGDLMGMAGSLNDNADISAPVFSYEPNDYGLYCMAGNVNEWVADVYRPLSFLDVEEFQPFRGNVITEPRRDNNGDLMRNEYGEIIHDTIADYRNFRDGSKESQIVESGDWNLEEEKRTLDMYIQDDRPGSFSSLISDEVRVYKGGSWKDRAYWLVPGTRRYLEQTKAQNDLGFRCAMTRVGSPEGF